MVLLPPRLMLRKSPRENPKVAFVTNGLKKALALVVTSVPGLLLILLRTEDSNGDAPKAVLRIEVGMEVIRPETGVTARERSPSPDIWIHVVNLHLGEMTARYVRSISKVAVPRNPVPSTIYLFALIGKKALVDLKAVLVNFFILILRPKPLPRRSLPPKGKPRPKPKPREKPIRRTIKIKTAMPTLQWLVLFYL